jgi:hypothetical protein
MQHVPIMLVPIEGREQSPLGGAAVGLDDGDIHPNIPFAQGALLKAGVGRMIDLEDEKLDDLRKQLRWGLCRFRATLSQAEFALEVRHLEPREFVFVDDLIVSENLIRA